MNKKVLFMMAGVALYGSTIATTIPSLHSVLKVVTYQEQALTDGSYSAYAYGSAISLGDKKILTNAHVILDYEYNVMDHIAICVTDDAFVEPECQTTATVIAYDVDQDIALLEMTDTIAVEPVTIDSSELALGDYVQVLGFPSNGGSTISLTQGRISGKERDLYKIDANLDGGNSGGGAFDEDGEFIGMPVSVQVGYTTMGYMIPADDVQKFVINHQNDSAMSVVDDGFYEYITTTHKAQKEGAIENNFFSFDGFKEYGYELVDSAILPSLGSYQYMFSSSNQKTTITIAVTPYNIASDDPGYDLETQLEEVRDRREVVIYREGVSLRDRERDILYMDGYKWSDEPNKSLTFFHGTDNYLYTYNIDTNTASNDSLYDGLRALIYGYIIHQYDELVDLHQFGELLLPDTLTLSDPQSLGEGMTMSLSYGDAIEGTISYDMVNQARVDTGSYEDTIRNMCEWMEEDSNCKNFRLQNDSDIIMNITTYDDTYSDERQRQYEAVIIDSYDDEYVNYEITITVENTATYTEQVEAFLQKIQGDIERVFDETPELQTRW